MKINKNLQTKKVLTVLAVLLLFTPLALSQDIYVSNYGGLPDDSVDDSTAIQNAIDAAQPSDRIVFAKGVYNLSSSSLINNAVLNITKKMNITLIGVDTTTPATLMLDGMDGSFFYIHDCNGINFENITLDSSRPAFSQGEILARGTLANSDKYIDISLESGFSLDSGLKVKVMRKIQTYNGSVLYTQDPFTVSCRENGTIVGGNNGFETSIQGSMLRVVIPTSTSPDNVSFYRGNFDDDMTVGTRFSMMHRVYDYPAFKIEKTHNVSFKDAEINLCNGIGVKAITGENYSFDNFKFIKKSGFVATCCADGIQTQDISGHITIDNSYFSGTCDDAIAIHNKFLYVEQVNADCSFVAFWGVPGPARPAVGEDFEILTDLGVKKGVGTFNSVQYINGKYTMTAAITYESGFSTLAVDDIFDIIDRIPTSVQITDSTFEELRGRGVLLRTRNATVDNCIFRRTTGPAIYMAPSFYDWKSSSVPKNITVKNCKTYLCPYWHDYSEATLVLKAKLEDGSSGPSSLCSDIVIKNNTFNSSPNSLMYLTSNVDILVSGNTMYSCGLNALADNGDTAIYFDNADAVTLKYNRYLSSDAPATIRWTDSCTDLLVTGNSGVLHDNPPF